MNCEEVVNGEVKCGAQRRGVNGGADSKVGDELGKVRAEAAATKPLRVGGLLVQPAMYPTSCVGSCCGAVVGRRSCDELW